MTKRLPSFAGRAYAAVLLFTLAGAGLGLGGVRVALRDEAESLVRRGVAPEVARTMPDRLRARVVASVLGGAALGGIAAATVILAVTRRRIRTLTTAFERMQTDLHVDMPAPPAAEFAEVREAFRRMRDAIEGRVSSLATADADRARRVARLAHDMANPMTTLLGVADLLESQKEGREDPEREALYELLHSELDRVTALLQDLRAVARAREAQPAARTDSDAQA